MYPLKVVGRGSLVLVNMQRTPVDDLTNVRIYARMDEFFRVLMGELGIDRFDTETDILEEQREDGASREV
jgi:hypothetical protein